MTGGEDRQASSLPLAGRRVVVTRARAQASALCQQIEELGGVPFEFPVIQIAWAEDLTPLDRALEALETFDWVMFTSVNAVEMFFERIRQIKCPHPSHLQSPPKFAAVGSKTSAALQQAGVSVEVTAEEFVAEGLLDTLGDRVRAGQNILMPRANIARKQLPDALRAIGCAVTEVELYRTLPLADRAEELLDLLTASQVDFVTFTSSSTVKNFVQAFKGHPLSDLLQGVVLCAIGPVTAKTATEYGLSIDIMPETYTIDHLVSAMAEYQKQRNHSIN